MRKNLYQDLYELEDVHWWHNAKRELVITLIKKYKPRVIKKIVDIGCGTGKNIEALQEIGATWGIDKAQEAINYCQKRGIKQVKLGGAEMTGLPAKSVSIITLLDVLEHTDEEKTIREAERILLHHGLLVITVPAFQFLWSQWDVVLHHKKRYTIKNLKDILKANGFKIVKISYVFSFLLIPTLIIRKIKSFFYKDSYTSDFRLSNTVINQILFLISSIERFFITHWGIPFGTSIVCVARRDE